MYSLPFPSHRQVRFHVFSLREREIEIERDREKDREIEREREKERERERKREGKSFHHLNPCIGKSILLNSALPWHVPIPWGRGKGHIAFLT